MRLTIQNFRIWREADIEFPDGKITLIKGKNGVGKSNLLEALQWVLYGKKQHITPWHNEKAITKVTLFWADLTVTRQSPKVSLTVTRGDLEITAKKAAQDYINNLFGIEPVMELGSYIRQMEFNLFLTESQRERQRLLSLIVTGSDEENPHVAKIRGVNQETDTNLRIAERDYERVLAKGDKYSDVQEDDLLDDATVAKYKAQLKQVKLDLQETLVIIESNTRIQTQITRQERELVQHQDQLSRLSPPKPVELLDAETYHRELALLNTRERNLQLTKRLERITEVLNLHDIPDAVALGTRLKQIDDELAQVREECHRARRIATVLKQQHLSADKVAEEVTNIEARLANQGARECFMERDRLRNEITKIQQRLRTLPQKATISAPEPVPLPNPVDLLPLHQQLNGLKHELDLAQKLLTCPECQTSLILQQRKLVKAVNSSAPDALIAQINTLKAEISMQTQANQAAQRAYDEYLDQKHDYEDEQAKLAQTRELTERLNEAQNRLTEVEVDLGSRENLSPETLRSLNQRLSALRSILSELDLDPIKLNDTLESLQDEHKQLEELMDIQRELKILGLDTSSAVSKWTVTSLKEAYQASQRYQTALQKYQHEQLKLTTQVETLTKSLETLRSELKSVTKTPEQLRERIERYEDCLSYHEQAVEYQAWNKEVKQLENTVHRFEERQVIGKTFLNTAREIELESYADFIEQMNANLASLLEKLFDEPITVGLTLHKELASGQTRLNVRLGIYFQGRELDFNTKGSLSTGQRFRISLAVTLSFNRLLGLPFLILDESFAYLDTEASVNSIEIIRECFPDLTCVVVKQDPIEGLYDQVIDAEQLKKKPVKKTNASKSKKRSQN
jgi:DNA repair exonuclease SbcCD ATPase subunit